MVRDKMKNFKGYKELMEAQECISSLRFESRPKNIVYTSVYLENDITKSPDRPHETTRYKEYIRNRLNIDFKVDDDFELFVPDLEVTVDERYVVGDRTYSKDADTRRKFDILSNSGKFPIDKCLYLNYNDTLVTNLNIIKKSNKPFITTFTGISILADLMKKETMVFYPEDLSFWDNKPIVYSFYQHFYRNRNSELIALSDM